MFSKTNGQQKTTPTWCYVRVFVWVICLSTVQTFAVTANTKTSKKKFDTIDELSSKVNTLSDSVDSNTESISQILKAQKEQTNRLKTNDSDSS